MIALGAMYHQQWNTFKSFFPSLLLRLISDCKDSLKSLMAKREKPKVL
jgi:hypothetical protein